jgi:hypothetical protein
MAEVEVSSTTPEVGQAYRQIFKSFGHLETTVRQAVYETPAQAVVIEVSNLRNFVRDTLAIDNGNVTVTRSGFEYPYTIITTYSQQGKKTLREDVRSGGYGKKEIGESVGPEDIQFLLGFEQLATAGLNVTQALINRQKSHYPFVVHEQSEKDYGVLHIKRRLPTAFRSTSGEDRAFYIEKGRDETYSYGQYSPEVILVSAAGRVYLIRLEGKFADFGSKSYKISAIEKCDWPDSVSFDLNNINKQPKQDFSAEDFSNLNAVAQALAQAEIVAWAQDVDDFGKTISDSEVKAIDSQRTEASSQRLRLSEENLFVESGTEGVMGISQRKLLTSNPRIKVYEVGDPYNVEGKTSCKVIYLGATNEPGFTATLVYHKGMVIILEYSEKKAGLADYVTPQMEEAYWQELLIEDNNVNYSTFDGDGNLVVRVFKSKEDVAVKLANQKDLGLRVGPQVYLQLISEFKD